MKSWILITTLISSSSFAYQQGTYNCDVDAFTTSTIVLGSVKLGQGLQVPYVESSYTKNGVTHKIKAIATVDLQTSEKRDEATGQKVVSTIEVLSVAGASIISFDQDGNANADCVKKN